MGVRRHGNVKAIAGEFTAVLLLHAGKGDLLVPYETGEEWTQIRTQMHPSSHPHTDT